MFYSLKILLASMKVTRIYPVKYLVKFCNKLEPESEKTQSVTLKELKELLVNIDCGIIRQMQITKAL